MAAPEKIKTKMERANEREKINATNCCAKIKREKSGELPKE